MTGNPQRRFSSRWPWAITILGVVVANVLLLGTQTGQCIDYALESGAESTCTSGPIIGIAGAWVLGIVSLLAVAYCTYRLVQSFRSS